MRTIKNIGVIHDDDYAKFPQGTIKNETDVAEGTPVVREIYGDLLTNIYAYLADRKIVPNQLEDNQLNGYQFIQALRRLVNELNDVEQVLTLTNGSTWNCDFDLSILPDKYVFFARATEDYDDTVNYVFKGAGLQQYPFISSTGFTGGTEILVVIDQATVRAYNISGSVGNTLLNELFTVFGTPIEYLDSTSKIWYKQDGKIFSDLPEIYDLQTSIRDNTGRPYLVHEMMQIERKIVCVCFDSTVPRYDLFYFEIDDWNNPIQLNPMGFTMSNNAGKDRKMHTYFNGEFVYFTNGADSTDVDGKLVCAVFDFINNRITFVANYTTDDQFEKTTNAVATDKGIVTLVDGVLRLWEYTGGGYEIGTFNSFIGNIFKVKKDTYYTNGEVAKKWTLPA